MSEETSLSEKAIFEAVIDLPVAERPAYLQSVCKGDLSLRKRVEALLDALGDVGSFLERSVPAGLTDTVSVATSAGPVEGPGQVIGSYKLLQKIGEGGMGIVYMADQETPIRRRVALKIIKPGMDSAQVIARFEAERQALAMMDHPNIAKVFDAGTTPSGRPYFVMELVQGVPITQHCDNKRYTLRERLELFVQVCQAIQHAHQKGIIHRDLKPSNILIAIYDGKPVPKVIDFGVAKALHQHLTEKTLFTHFGGVIGTPQYMSPEQTEMDMLGTDTRSDIYTLGVLLYELLTGTTPLDIKELRAIGFARVMQTIREIEPPKPSTRLSTAGDQLASISASRATEPVKLARSLAGDLDWIVMKAIEKDRSRRYETANELGRDVERYLRDEPVEAMPPSAVYRFRKLARRHKRFAAVLFVSAIFLLIFAGSSVVAAIVFSRQEEQQRKLADANARLAQSNKLIATERENQLADNFTARGLGDGNTTWNARAALWFATAAVTAREDPDRVRANMVRVKNWLRGQWNPAAIVGQKDDVDQLAFDPANSRYLITFKRHGTSDAPAGIWDLSAEQSLTPPQGFGRLADAAWGKGGNLLLGSETGHVALVSVPDMKIQRHWDAGAPVQRVAISANGLWVAAASGKRLLVWSASGNANPAITEFPAELVHIRFTPAGGHLVTATESDSRAQAFSITSAGSDPPQIQQTLGPVTHVYRGLGDYFTRPPEIVADGRELATIQKVGTADEPGILARYDIATGAELAILSDQRFSSIRGTSLSPDGHTLAMSNALYDISANKMSQTLSSSLRSAFSPNGKFFVNSDSGIEVIKFDQGKMTTRAYPLVNRVGQPAVSQDNKFLAVSVDGVVQVWKFPTPAFPTPVDRRVLIDGRSTCAAFSPDGLYALPVGDVAGTTVRTIQVCAAATGLPLGRPLALDANLVSAEFSPDSRLVAAVTGALGDPRLLRLWNWEKGSLVHTPLKLDSEPVSVCFAPDGKAMAVHCVNRTVLLIDPATGGELMRLQCRETRMVAGSTPWMSGRGTIRFSHDGRTVFTWGSPVIQAWDRETGRERFAVRHTRDCWVCAESPDGKTIATGGIDGKLRLWDATNGHELLAPIEHPNQVLSVAFSPDGRLVGTACLDWQTRVWDVATGRLAHAMSPGGWLTDLRFTPDGHFTVNAGASGVQVWDTKTGHAVSQRFGTSTGDLPQLDISRDGRWAVISAANNFFSVIDLQMLTGEIGGTPEDALMWTELLSNARIAGSTVVNLSDAEWLARWREYRRLHPEFHPMAEN